MDIVPWRPFGRELSSFRREMDRLWDRFFSEDPLGRRFPAEWGEWSPSVDVSESEDKILIKAELPGIDAKDVDVNVTGNRLTIRGEKRREEEEKDEHHHYAERFYGAFQRVFTLPATVNPEKVEATFDKGVLHITLPKAEETKRKKITIKST